MRRILPSDDALMVYIGLSRCDIPDHATAQRIFDSLNDILADRPPTREELIERLTSVFGETFPTLVAVLDTFRFNAPTRIEELSPDMFFAVMGLQGRINYRAYLEPVLN